MTEATKVGDVFSCQALQVGRVYAISFTSPFSSYPLLLEKFVRTADLMSMPCSTISGRSSASGGRRHSSCDSCKAGGGSGTIFTSAWVARSRAILEVLLPGQEP